MFKRLLFLLLFCLIFSVLSFLGQERERELPSKPETREVEAPRNDPPPPRNDPPPPPPPRNDPPPPREEPRQSNNSSSSNNSSNNDEPSRARRRDRDSDSDQNRPGRGRSDEDLRKPRKPENPTPIPPPNPTPNPSPTPSPNPVPPGNNNGSNSDKDKEDREEERRRRNRNRGNYPYPPVYYPAPVPTTPTTFSWRMYFDKDDVFFNIYGTYVESNQAEYLPFFDTVLSGNYIPLYYIYGREFYRNEFPFVASDWTIYYEPDLDDIFVDFDKFGKVGYERLVMVALGDTIKSVNKKFKNSGQAPRPVLVETLPLVDKDKLYSFNVKDLPKGEYEIRFIARDGTTLKHSIRIK